MLQHEADIQIDIMEDEQSESLSSINDEHPSTGNYKLMIEPFYNLSKNPFNQSEKVLEFVLPMRERWNLKTEIELTRNAIQVVRISKSPSRENNLKHKTCSGL